MVVNYERVTFSVHEEDLPFLREWLEGLEVPEHLREAVGRLLDAVEAADERVEKRVEEMVKGALAKQYERGFGSDWREYVKWADKEDL